MNLQQSTSAVVINCHANSLAYALDPSTGTVKHDFTTPSYLYHGDQHSETDIVVSGNSGKLNVLSMENGTVTKTLTGHGGSNIRCVANIPSIIDRVATGGDDKCISIWDVNAGTELAKLQGHTALVRQLTHHPLAAPEFVFTSADDWSVRQWDHGQETCVRTLQGHTSHIRALRIDPHHQILFSGSHDKTLIGWDYRSGEKILTLPYGNYVESVLVREESNENQLVVPVHASTIHVLDLRNVSDNRTTHELRSWNHGHRDHVMGTCDVPDQNLFVTVGYSCHHAKAWRDDGTCVWDHTAPNTLWGAFSFVNDYDRFVDGSAWKSCSTTPVGEFLSSNPKAQENKEFLIAEAETLHDATIEISYGSNGESETFHSFQSLINAASLRVAEPAEFGTVMTHRVIMDHLSLTEITFLGVLLGTVSVDEEFVQNNVTELLDLCEILDKLDMKRMLWFIVERVRDICSEGRLAVCFNLFKQSFLRFESRDDEEEEEEGEEESDEEETIHEVKFDKVISLACFEALRKKSLRGKKLSKRMRKWVMSQLLTDTLMIDQPSSDLRGHGQLSMIPEDVPCLPPNELLAEALATFAENTTSPNVELFSELEERGTAVASHIEVLILTFDFFKMMLRFDGRERDQFMRRRQLVMNGLSSYSLRLLTCFAYVGQFPDDFDVNESLLDVVLILSKAEEDSNQRLTSYCVDHLKRVDTSSPTFLQSILNLGNAFDENIQSRLDILESWATQGHYTVKQLLKKLLQAEEKARRKFDMAAVLRRLGALERENRDLKEQVEALTEKLSDHQIDSERRIETLENRVAEMLHGDDSSDDG